MLKEINDLIDNHGKDLEIQERDGRINFGLNKEHYFYTLATTDNNRAFIVKRDKENKKVFLGGEWLLNDELETIMEKLKKHI
jgi:hypothetical protein